MNKTISGLMLALLAIAGAAPSFAADRDRGTSARQQFNQPRMQQGTRSGDATRSASGASQRSASATPRTEWRQRTDGQVAQSGQRERFQGFNRPGGDAQRERQDGDRRWAGQQDQRRQTDGHDRHASRGDQSRDGDGRRHGQDHNRGHDYGRDNNRGNHYGWDNNRGRHNGWDNNRGNHYGWDNNRGRHNGWDNNRGNHYGWDNNRGRHNGWDNNRGHDGFRGRPTYGWDRSIDRRQEHQRERIVQGMRSGELTRHEAQRLFAEQRDLRQQERAFRSDGVLSPWERREMHQDLNAAGRHIYNQAHDDQQRF